MAGSKKEVSAIVEDSIAQVELSKEQILASAKYGNVRDLVNALLEERKKYTLESVDKMIDEFMKGRVI